MARTDEIFERKDAMGYFEQLAEIRREEAVEEGRKEGVQETLEKAVRSLLTHSEFTPAKIAELLEVRVSLVKRIKKEMASE